jgi:hypothetical protein
VANTRSSQLVFLASTSLDELPELSELSGYTTAEYIELFRRSAELKRSAAKASEQRFSMRLYDNRIRSNSFPLSQAFCRIEQKDCKAKGRQGRAV